MDKTQINSLSSVHRRKPSNRSSEDPSGPYVNQLETFIKYAPGAMAMVDLDLRYLIVNDGWYQAYQLDKQDIIGKSHYEIFPQIMNMPEWLELHRRALSGEELSEEADEMVIDGEKIYLNLKLKPWYDEDETVGGIIMYTEIITEQVLEKRRLKAHDNVLRTLLNEMEDGFAHARIVRNEKGNPIDWQYLNVGRGLEKYVPVPPETLTGKKVSDAIPGAIEADPKWLDIFNEVATTGKSKEIEEYSLILDRWFRMNIYSPAKDEFATIFRDTTSKNKAEQDLKNLNELFQEVSELARVGVWEIDITTQKCFWSKVVYEIHEEDPSKEIKVEDGINYFHPDHQNIIQEAVDKAIVHKKPYDLELKIITAKGREVWTRAIGQPIFEEDEVVKLRGLFQDIDLQKKKEIQLKEDAKVISELNERMEFAKETAGLGVWDWDITQNVLHWDHMMYELYGLKPDDFTNCYEAWQQGLHPEDREKANKEVQQCITEKKILNTQFRVIRSSGEIRQIGARGMVIYDELGNPTRMIGMNWDMTEEVARKEEIISLNENLQKMVNEKTKDLRKTIEELESFSYSISHDLRAPLRAINGYSVALTEEIGNSVSRETANYLSRIITNSEKMGNLIDDLLEFSRLNRRKINKEKIDLAALTNQLIDEVFPESRQHIQLDPLPEIQGDQQMITQVLTNLLSNAIKYSSRESNPRIEISFKEENGMYIIRFMDNGVGFNMKYYKKIFKVFERLHGEHEFEGTGIGLSLSQRIMKAHDGQIWAESEEGKGATFFISFNKPTR